MSQSKYKIILIGDVEVGKTSFLYSATNRPLTNVSPTMGIQFLSTSINWNGKSIKIQIWDTTGSERYRAITSTYYKKAQGVILMFDITNKKSFESIMRWNEEVDQKAKNNVCKILIGNKIDLVEEGKKQPQVTEEQLTNFCVEKQTTFKKTSALKGAHVKEALLQLVQSTSSIMIEIIESRFDSQPGNQYTSILQNYGNTTINIQPPPNSSESTSNSCSKCC